MSRRPLWGLLSDARKRVLLAAVAVSPALWASNAGASATYLPVLQDEYGYTGSNCLICHQTEVGMPDNATKAFAVTLKAKGLEGQRPDLMSSIMMDLEAELEMPEPTDSDGDNVPDLIEIMEKGDPNDGSIKPGGYTPVEYGCSIVNAVGHSTPGRGGDPLAFLLSTFVAVSLLFDRRRRLRRA